MIARLALLPDAPRRVVAAAIVLAAFAVVALLAAGLLASLVEREARRADLIGETERLHDALEQRIAAAGPPAPAPAPSADAAETALIDLAGVVTGRLAEAPVRVTVSGPRGVRMAGVEERRVEIVLTAAPEALAGALSGLAVETARVSFFDVRMIENGEAQARIVFTLAVEGEAP